MKTKFKKITPPVLIGIISFYISGLFLLGIIAGYVVMQYFSGKVKSIRFSVGNYRIHLHHWLYSALFLATIFISGVYDLLPVFVLGIWSGFIFQGIYCYNDWHKILTKKQK